MNRAVALTSVAIAAILGGCTSLEQAQLVYVSTNQIGIVASGGKAESPTPSIIIGYSGVDVAIVPVAVAKKCNKDALAAVPDNSVSPNCKNIDPSIDEIVGTHKNSISKSDQGRIDRLDSEIAILNKEVSGDRSSLNNLIDQLNKYKIRRDTVNKEIEIIETELSSMSAIDDSDPIKKLKKNKKDKYLEDKDKLDDNIRPLENQIEPLKYSLSEKQKEVENKQIELDTLQRSTNNTTGDDKEDALSVYGTFDGSAKSNPKDNTGLDVGKTFSTGIAAQNITQGLREAGRPIAAAKCYSAALELLESAPGAKTPAAVQAAIDGCSHK